MSDQDPKTPELIANLQWLRVHGLRNWPYILLAILIFLPVLAYKLGFFDRWVQPSGPIAMEKKSWPDYRGCVTESPYGDPPLLVKFSDGKEAYVNFRTLIQMDTARAEDAAKIYYAPLDAYLALLESIKGAVYGELERRTESFVRKNRGALAAKIVELTRPMQEKTAFMVQKFDFLEFCTPNTSRASTSNSATPGVLHDRTEQH